MGTKAWSVLCVGLIACGLPEGRIHVGPEAVDPTQDAGSIRDAGTPPSDERSITAVVLKASQNPGLTTDVTGSISGTSVALTLPAGTALTALRPTITFVGSSVSPASDVAEDFTAPLTYSVIAASGASTDYSITVTDQPPACVPTATGCTLDVYNRAVAFAANHPTRTNGTSWDGWCGALMMQFGGFGVSAPSAIAAYHATTIVSLDPTTAPIGAFHYWNYGVYGHVGVDLLGQGAVVFMASAHLGDSWNPYIGVNSIGAYEATTGAQYLGWSMEYNGHGQRLAGGGACGSASVPNGCALPQTPTETTGVPDVAFVMRMQRYAADHGYTGALDGQSNAATWAGLQRGLAAEGYTGPADGLPASHTYLAFQKLAAAYGYSGPQNGVLGPNSFRGFATFLNQAY